jgi:glycerophosphoryl diester phosphodiesterase
MPVEVVGHGGAGDFYPGNSLQSIEKALELGVDRIEVDIQRAAGDQLVLVHDDEITVDGRKRRIRDMSVEELRAALDGLLTLPEAIELVHRRAGLLVDMKRPGNEALVTQAICAAAIAPTTLVSSTYAWSLRRVKQQAPQIGTGLSTGHISTVMRQNKLISITSGVLAAVTPLPFITTAKLIHADYLMLNYRICTPRFIRAAHRSNLKVYAWTVNNPKLIRRMIERGVDGIISNRPDLVDEGLARR